MNERSLRHERLRGLGVGILPRQGTLIFGTFFFSYLIFLQIHTQSLNPSVSANVFFPNASVLRKMSDFWVLPAAQGLIIKPTIDKLITRYKSSLLKLRGDTIARTETIQSLNRSQHEALMQAADMGAVKQKDIQFMN